MLTFGSLFAGIGGFDLALERCGFVSAFQVEKNAQANQILAHHWPDVPRIGDVREARGERLPSVQLLCGGFPCQDLSVAGKRAGLAGNRSGLFFEFARLIAEITPEWVFVENVPGLVSSWSPVEPAPVLLDGGEWEVDETSDLETVVSTLVELGYGVAWRCLDAQYFGLAQRRDRVFIVGRLGDARLAAQVLFESESCERHPPAGGAAREEVAGPLGSSADGAGWRDDLDRSEAFVTGTMTANGDANSGFRLGDGLAIAKSVAWRGRGMEMAGDVANAIRSGGEGHTGDQMGYVMFQANGDGSFRAVAPSVAASDDNGSNHVVVCDLRNGNLSGGTATPVQAGCHGPSPNLIPHVVHALRAEGHDASEDGTGRGTPLVVTPIDMRQASRGEKMTNNRGEGVSSGGAPGTGIGNPGDPCPSLGGSHTPAVMAFETTVARNGRGAPSEITRALRASEDGGRSDCKPYLMGGGLGIRRLTPLECCRLQGFPDDWLDIDPPLSDSAKYRLLGNAVAVPVVQWIADRIMRLHMNGGYA